MREPIYQYDFVYILLLYIIEKNMSDDSRVILL